LQQDAKYDAGMEADARGWLEAIAGEPFPAGSFHEALKDKWSCAYVMSFAVTESRWA